MSKLNFLTIKKSPIFILTLGLMLVLAATTNVITALTLGIATALIIIISGVLIFILQRFIPENLLFSCSVIIVAALVSMAVIVMNAYFAISAESLGVYLPLTFIFCIRLIIETKTDNKKSLKFLLFENLYYSGIFILTLFVLASVREILGAGTFANIQLFGGFVPLSIIMLPAGAFLCVALLMAGVVSIKNYMASKSKGSTNKSVIYIEK